MKFWTYTKINQLITNINEDGLPCFEKKLTGWNDNNSLSDVEDIVTVNAVINNNGSELALKVIYCSEEAKNNSMINLKCEEIERELMKEVSLWLNGND